MCIAARALVHARRSRTALSSPFADASHSPGSSHAAGCGRPSTTRGAPERNPARGAGARAVGRAASGSRTARAGRKHCQAPAVRERHDVHFRRLDRARRAHRGRSSAFGSDSRRSCHRRGTLVVALRGRADGARRLERGPRACGGPPQRLRISGRCGSGCLCNDRCGPGGYHRSSSVDSRSDGIARALLPARSEPVCARPPAEAQCQTLSLKTGRLFVLARWPTRVHCLRGLFTAGACRRRVSLCQLSAQACLEDALPLPRRSPRTLLRRAQAPGRNVRPHQRRSPASAQIPRER
jgi:hypothetical protein